MNTQLQESSCRQATRRTKTSSPTKPKDTLALRIAFARQGLELSLSERQLEERLKQSLSATLSPEEEKVTIILNARTLLDCDSDSRFFAGRILLTYIYEETLPWQIGEGSRKLKEAHKKAFLKTIPKGIELGRLDARLASFDLGTLAEGLDPSADLNFDFIGIQTLYDRYLIHTQDSQLPGKKRRLESPQIFWMRVAMGLALLESDKQAKTLDFYTLMSQRLACPSTPTLFNSGTTRPQLSSCYLLNCGDSIEEIAETWTRFSHLSKWAGGLGCSWSSVRGSGAYIEGTNGESTGVIPFLKVASDICLAVNQGGKRPGALCSYLELWHSDVEDFLDLRKETGDDRRRTHNMNTALWIPDLFMKRLEQISLGVLSKEATWTLLQSSDVTDLPEIYGAKFEERYSFYEAQVEKGVLPGKKIRILSLWKRILSSIFETGHPWITFKDPCNVRSPQDHAGVVHSSNLCTEITLNTSREEVAVCNLASINISRYLRADGSINHLELARCVATVIRMLDNVIDINYYPTDSAKLANTRHRPVGLGMMGMQDALFAKRICFDSEAAVAFNDEITEIIAYYAYQASSDLAAERGVYSSFKGSKWDRGILPLDSLDLLEKERGTKLLVDRNRHLDWSALRGKIRMQGMRNSNCMAIAPTATISNIMGSSPCIEPIYKHIHTKSNLSGEFVRANQYLQRDLIALGLWDEEMLAELKRYDGSIQPINRIPDELKKLYKTAFEIEPTWIIQSAAVRQKWIDQSQSVNLFLADNDARKASFMYREAWSRGLKSTYYLRTINRSSIDSAIKTATQTTACSIEAMRNGTVCEACQ